MKRIFALVVFLSFTAAAGASGDRIGNGGTGIECTDGKGGTTLEVLDLYTAEADYGLTPDFAGAQSENYLDLVKAVGDRYTKVAPARGSFLWFVGSNFLSEADLRPGIKLLPTPDSGAQEIPAHCEIRQIVVQRELNSILPGQKRYLVSKDLWDRLDARNKAALVLHEAIYFDYMTMANLPGPTDEKGNPDPTVSPIPDASFVRYFNAHLLSKAILSVNQRDLACYAKRRIYEANGEVIGEPDCFFDSSHNGIYLQVLSQWPIEVGKLRAPAISTDFLKLPGGFAPRCQGIVASNVEQYSEIKASYSLYGCGEEVFRAEIPAMGKSVAAIFKAGPFHDIFAPDAPKGYRTDDPQDGQLNFRDDRENYGDNWPGHLRVNSGILVEPVVFPDGQICFTGGLLARGVSEDFDPHSAPSWICYGRDPGHGQPRFERFRVPLR